MHRHLFFLLILFLPTQFGYHFWPEWALVLGRRVDYLSPTLYITDILIVSLLFFRKLHWKLPIFLFIGCSVNILFARNYFIAAYAWLKVCEFVLLGAYIYREKIRVLDVVFPYSLAMLYSSLFAIVQFLKQGSLGGILYFLGERTFTAQTPGIARADLWGEFLRPYATFPHPNVLGGFLAVGMLLIIQNSNVRNKYYTFVIFLSSVALFLTLSRSAWVALALGLIFVRKKLGLLSVGIIVCIIAVFPSLQDESVVVRGQLNHAALSIWRDSPVTGTGLGNFLVALPDYLVSRQIYFLQPVHNIYLLLLAEFGLIGIVMLSVGIFQIRRILSPFPLFLFPILIIGLFDHYPLTLQQGQLLLTLAVSLYLTDT